MSRRDIRHAGEPPTDTVRHGQESRRRIATAGVLTAVALLFGYIEAILPFQLGIPGVKLGLSHIVTLFALYRLSPWETAAVTLLRVTLSALLFGSVPALAYSAVGAALSLAVMMLLRRCGRFSVMGISVAGGVAHNIGQLACAALLMQTPSIALYLPVLLAAGCLCGGVIGVVAAIPIARVDVGGHRR